MLARASLLPGRRLAAWLEYVKAETAVDAGKNHIINSNFGYYGQFWAFACLEALADDKLAGRTQKDESAESHPIVLVWLGAKEVFSQVGA